MARCLIIGCGCRGRLLARALQGQGHPVRGTSRAREGCGKIEAAGLEPVLADPDVVATLVPAFGHVTVACILLGSAAGSSEKLSALHTTRLEMLLTKLVDTTVRGVVYEARGSIPAELLDGGAARVRAYAERSLARYALIRAEPSHVDSWLEAGVKAFGTLIEAGPRR